MKPEEPLKTEALASGTTVEAVRETDKVMLILSYLGLLALVPLLTVKDSPYVTWHAKNGLVLGVGGVIVSTLVGMVLGPIPIIGFLVCALWPALIVLHVLAMVKALQGIRWRIPGVTDLAEKL
jgi:fumarate reductase subunit D